MNIFLHELRAYRKSTIIWTCSLIAIVIFFLSLYPSIAKDYGEFSKIIEGYPEGVRKAFGLEIESFGTILGFYSYLFLYITLCGSIQAMIIGTSIVSKESREKTADFLLTKPVTRSKVLTAKLFAGVFSLIITNVFYLAAANIMASQVKTVDYSYRLFFLISITLLIIQLIFFSIGIFVSVIFTKLKAVLSVSLGTVFGFFVIGMIISPDGNSVKRYLSPFKYFDTNYIIEHARFEYSYLISAIMICIISIVASYLIYLRKDIHAV